MKIVDAEAYIRHFPLAEPFHPSWIPGLPMHNNSAVILRLITDEGVEGACAGMAEDAHIAYNPHTWSNGLGLAANLQLMGAIPNCTHCEFPYDPPGWVPEGRDAMLTEPITIDEEGYVAVPQSPGLGVEVGWEKVRAHG